MVADGSDVKNLAWCKRKRRVVNGMLIRTLTATASSLCDTLQMPTVHVAIDDELKKKCPRGALGCVTVEVQAGDTPTGLSEELKSREEQILRLPEPRAVLESPQIWRRAQPTGRWKRPRTVPRLGGGFTAARDRQ